MQKKKRMFWCVVLAAVLWLSGCGKNEPALTDGREVYVKSEEAEKTEASKETEETDETGKTDDTGKTEQEQRYLLTGLDTEQKKITLRAYQGQEEKEYDYTGGTLIKDKYGNNITMEQLGLGEMVTTVIEKDKVKSIQVSDEGFTYGDIHNFTLNTEAKTITVGKENYYYDDDLLVFFGNSKISLAELSEWDTICLKGIEKKVYAVQVTEGHGTVVLQNTDLFVGGNITIGNVLSLNIEKDMRIEMPEGTYLLSVANDGYGGSMEITVEANRETTVNLDELKGEGPKYSTVAFTIEPENAVLYLNNEMVDLSQPLQLKYGRYSLSAKAEGYADWDKTLVVNSQSANIRIELQTTEEAEAEAETQAAAEEETETQDSGRELEESVKELIEQIRNNTISTTDSSTLNSTLNSNLFN